MSPAQPALSVVLVVGEARLRAAAALRSILVQSLADAMEVLVVDCASPEWTPLPGSDHPNVRVIRQPHGTDFGAARAEGVRQARATVVAFLEEHCIALPGWAEALARAHEGPWAAVGGEVYNANAGIGFSDAVYLLGYTPWLPPAPRGEAPSLAAHNSSFKRQVLLEYRDRLPRLLNAEPILFGMLRAAGQRLYVEPGAKFLHFHETRPSALRAYFWWNCCFGSTRATIFRWPRGKRWLYALSTPAIPLARLARLTLEVLRRRRERLWSLLSNIPAILLVLYVAVAGQALGLVFDPAGAEARFSRLELHDDHDR
ncbi:MAG TPA: glycosyltransferase [Anaerolineales bacterium]|nr:glycosyltransferase [Anaerolineales bacterium]